MTKIANEVLVLCYEAPPVVCTIHGMGDGYRVVSYICELPNIVPHLLKVCTQRGHGQEGGVPKGRGPLL